MDFINIVTRKNHKRMAWILLLSLLFFGQNSFGMDCISDDCYHLEAPSDLRVINADNSSISISWIDNSDFEDGFVIERCYYPDCKDDFSLFRTVALVSENTTFYNDDDIRLNTSYLYRVKAYNDVTESDYSNNVLAKSYVPSVVVYCFINTIAIDSSDLKIQIFLTIVGLILGMIIWITGHGRG